MTPVDAVGTRARAVVESVARAATAVVLLATTMVALSSRPATADPDIARLLRNDLAGASDIVVDEVHGHLFISEGTDALLVTDLSGRTVRELTGVVGAEQLVIDPGRGVVYVARRAATAISVIDTDDLSVSSFTTPGRCPSTLAPAGDVVWFTSYCAYGDEANGSLNAVDLGTGDVTEVTTDLTYEQAAVVSSPGRPGFLVVYDRLRNPSYITGYQASVDSGGPRLTQVSRVKREMMIDARISPDGSSVVFNESWAGAIKLSLPDLGFLGEYQLGFLSDGMSPNYPNPIAFRDDGALVLGMRWFRPGRYQPTNDLDFGKGYHQRYAGAWAGDHFYALVGNPYTDDGRTDYALAVARPRYPSTVSIRASRQKVTVGNKVTLDLSLDRPLPGSPRAVVVRALAPDGTPRFVARRDVGADGASIDVAPRRNTVYEASYAGNDLTSPAFDSTNVGVRSKVEVALVSDVTRRKGIAYARSGSTIWYSVRTAAFRTPRCVEVTLAVRPAVDWDFYDPTVCVPLGRDGRVQVGVQSRSGKRPYLHRMSVRLPATSDNEESRSSVHEFQFCRRSVPCEPPRPVYVGTSVLPGPRVWLKARQ